MVVRDLLELDDLKMIQEGDLDAEVTGGYMGDLLSVVMGEAEEGQAWITIQSHVNIVAVASLKGVPVIIIAHGFEPDEETLESAKEEEITLLGPKLDPFSIAKKLIQEKGL